MDGPTRRTQQQQQPLEGNMSKLSHAEKQAAMAALNEMAKRNGGRITAEQLVNAARDDDSPLHDYFEWDDTTAAHQWRITQARALIGSAKLNITINSQKVSCPGYVRDPTVDKMEQGYIQTAKIRTDEDAARDVLIREFDRVKSTIIRARKLATVLGMLQEMDSLVDTLDIMTTKIQDTGQRMPA
jgi:hypothetical protein